MVKVKELIKILEKDGWVQSRMKGSYRQFRDPDKGGTVAVA
jgi:predicted RNA binding protein YcfA (HicA-like mRNA interferase family)